METHLNSVKCSFPGPEVFSNGYRTVSQHGKDMFGKPGHVLKNQLFLVKGFQLMQTQEHEDSMFYGEVEVSTTVLVSNLIGLYFLTSEQTSVLPARRI